MQRINDSDELVAAFNADPGVHIYGLGDLDPAFWSRSRWYRRDGAVVGIIKLSEETPFTVVYAIAVTNQSATTRLLVELADEIPDGALATAPPGAAEWMNQIRSIDYMGPHHKLQITNPAKLCSAPHVVQLDSDDTDDLIKLYATDPGASFFLPAMLEGGLWAGIRDAGQLVAAGGTHVRGQRANVAALGGIITNPQARGQGFASQVTSFLASKLLATGAIVGLNVHADNVIARRMYRSLGFEHVHDYEEFEFLPMS